MQRYRTPPGEVLSQILSVDSLFLSERLRELLNANNRGSKLLDVSAFFPFSLPRRNILDFRRVIPDAMDTIQVFAKMEILLGRATGTVQHHIDNLNHLFVHALNFGIWDYRMLELGDLKSILNNTGFSASKCLKICSALRMLYFIMGSFFGQSLVQMDIDGLDRLISQYSSDVRAVKNANKTPDIDPEYFEVLEARLPIIIMDKTLGINYRICAALLLLELYTGLRPSELTTLKTNSHIVKRTATGKSVNYLRYGVPKLSHGGQKEKYAECYMLPGAVTAFDALLSLRKEIPGYYKTDSLFILYGEGNTDQKRFDYYTTRLFRKAFKDLCFGEWEEVNLRIIEGQKYYIPNLTQYRVHLCSYLYREGVRLHIIELGMSHLTNAMAAYYVRVQDRTFRESQLRMDNVIRTQINNDFDLVKHEEKGEQMLDDFLLSLARFRVSVSRLAEMKEKGYDYEVDRYSKKCRNLYSTELYPCLSYLNRVIDEEGIESVLSRHPSLASIINEIDPIIKEIQEWKTRPWS